MRSPQLIERPGRWVLMVVAPLALAFGLAAFMIGRFVGFGTSFDLGSGFAKALQSSLLVAGGVALVSFAVGLPVGVLAVFYRFPARASLLVRITLDGVGPVVARAGRGDTWRRAGSLRHAHPDSCARAGSLAELCDRRAEVGIVLLLRPPGEDSLPVALFTIMANAPAAMVAVLCVVHLLSAAVPIALVLPRLLAQQR